MVNMYGYNRKTTEEDKAILAAVKRHHDIVASKGYLVVMTSLVGSQNYDLDDENSDIDTFSLVFPPLSYLARDERPQADCIKVEDGFCYVKDIRVAFRLLYNAASPNSVEYFASKYKVYNPVFESILHEYLNDNTRLWNMIHCNYSHMLYAMAGMARQLTTRNMSAGKRFSHALRLMNMHYTFLNSPNADAVLELRDGGDYELARTVKRDTSEDFTNEYNEQCEQIAGWLENYRSTFQPTEEQEQIQQYGLALIDSFRWKLFKKYLMETNK